jgi:peptide/nickel transport system permease protein
MNKLFTNRSFKVGFWLVAGLALVAIAAPYIAPYAPDAVDSTALLEPPSLHHVMGTDQLGRDVFSRLLYGARISLCVGVVVAVLASAVGILFGGVAGYYGGVVDYLLMRFTDVMLCFPIFFLILAVVAMLEPSVFLLIVILGLTGWMGQARLMRAEVLTLKNREYVLAARAYGAPDALIVMKHLLPNALAPVLVSAVLGVAYAILAESALSFLGLGIQPPTPSWGNMLNDAKAALGIAWWLNAYPGLAILLTILGFNLMGEGCQQSLDDQR